MKNKFRFSAGFLAMLICVFTLLAGCQAGTSDGTGTGDTDSKNETQESTGESKTAENSETLTLSGEDPTESEQSLSASSTGSEEVSTASKEEPIMTESIALAFTENTVYATGLDGGKALGTPVNYQAWVSTDFIDISSYAALKYELAAHRYLYSVAFFDENKTFLSGDATDSIIGYTILQGYMAVPDGAKYAKFANFTGSGEYSHTDPDVFAEGFPDAADFERYKSAIKFDGFKIVCLGDSLTEGDHGLYPGAANKHYLNYPYFLSKILGCKTVNNGRCGYTPSGYQSLFAGGSIDVSDADVVLIMLGTNGGLTYGGTHAQLAAYKQLVTMVKRKAPSDCVIVLLTPPHATTDPNRSNFGYAPWVENAVEEIRTFAASSKLPLIDVYEESPIQAENEDLYQPVDGLHLNAAGYEALADFIAKKLEEILTFE